MGMGGMMLCSMVGMSVRRFSDGGNRMMRWTTSQFDHGCQRLRGKRKDEYPYQPCLEETIHFFSLAHDVPITHEQDRANLFAFASVHGETWRLRLVSP